MYFIKKHLKKFLFYLTILILIILIGLSSVGRFADINIGFLGNLISSLQKVTYNIGQTLTSSFYSVQEIVKMREENLLLTEKVHELQEQVRILENVVNKSEAVEAEYEMKKNLEHDYVVGQVIGLDNSNWFSRFTIDKGENDGLKKNDIVIHAVESENGVIQVGLVGLITETSSNWSKVITILDETCRISFRDIDNEESGIVQGSIDGTVTGYFFNSKARANVGEQLVTSGIGEVYIPDIYIGTITDVVQTTDASTQRIVVKSAVEFTKLNKVFVLMVDR
ncbi:rod shape-determining protein MreC [Sedimentibacter sp. MB31-C6]|uniref:rod shape-determining protein MreC n=1 Tax=Sedimentibacter sp. MB31-C6 TaxID=3109366 RepID=UPI002DDD0019|nr:rod shape-determining protein MreC [Sedimentibacter sp. MB36-C1]WSI04384.1 rod shape-determining protein MreC [Sedimentibacter sp. MB36-C1]